MANLLTRTVARTADTMTTPPSGMTATKSIAAGLSGPVVIIANWLLTFVPYWSTMPMEVQAAFITIVTIGIPSAIVYFAPQNRRTIPNEPTEPEPPAGDDV